MLFLSLPGLLLLIGAFYLGLRAVRALEQRSAGSEGMGALQRRVRQLEDVVERQAEQIERLAEGQVFTERLLATRTEQPPPNPGGSRATFDGTT